MPIYEYECKECGRIQEVFQKMSEAPLTTCSHCQGKLHKILSHSSFHLKGSGWYVTDYGGKNAKSDQKTETKTSPSAEACGTSCTGNKSATGKSDSK